MIQRQIESFLQKRRCTLLGVGPMSSNCIDAAIELANGHDVPVMLIASRRQIDSVKFGGGYVNNWTTGQFAEYVIDADKKGQVILSRDHGGPWQNELEVGEKMSLRRAMQSAKESFREDIDAGFQILHIDPSVDIFGKPDVDQVLDRLYELYEFCWRYAHSLGREVVFEIGTEEQSGSVNALEELEYTLESMHRFCAKEKLPFPTFVVVQTGTRVLEMRNVGSFDSPVRVVDELPVEIQIPQMVEICKHYGVFIKEHNADYLSAESLQWHPRIGIHAANIAPEFGVAESRALVDLLRRESAGGCVDSFLQLAYDSGKWKKWMVPDSQASDTEKALIAGHYVFAHEEFIEIKRRAAEELGVDIDQFLKEKIKEVILQYLLNFRVISR